MSIKKHVAAPLGLAVAFAGGYGVTADAPIAKADGPDCRPFVLGIGGSQERAMEREGGTTVIMRHLEAAAAQGNRTESLDYESSVWPEGPYTLDASVADGEARASAEIARYRSECPDGTVTMIGHSLGAEVAGDISDEADHVVLYGDPRATGGILSAIPGIYPGTSAPGPRVLGPNTVSVVHEYDVIGTSPAPWSDPVRFGLDVQGYLTGWHYYAPGEADGLAEGQQYFVPEPSPNPNIPQNTPTGIPAAPIAPLPPVIAGPLPSAQDIQPLVQALESGQAAPLQAAAAPLIQETAQTFTIAPGRLQAIPAPMPAPDLATQVIDAVQSGFQNAGIQFAQTVNAVADQLGVEHP